MRPLVVSQFPDDRWHALSILSQLSRLHQQKSRALLLTGDDIDRHGGFINVLGPGVTDPLLGIRLYIECQP